LQAWDQPDGPTVLPGQYQVRLTVDGADHLQGFEVVRDPRIESSDADLDAQRDMLRELRDRLSETNRTINEIDALLDQTAIWQRRTSNETVRQAADSVEEQLREILPTLIDVNIHQAQLWPSGLHEKLNALFNSVDGADYAPPQQARDVFAELSEQLESAKARLAAIRDTEVRALNDAIASSRVRVVGD